MKFRRTAASILLSTLFLTSHGLLSPLHGQSIRLDPLVLEILKMEAAFEKFHRERVEYQRERDRQRLRIPGYNIQLSPAVGAFPPAHSRHSSPSLGL